MIYCTQCGKELNDNTRFCTGCGAAVKVMADPFAASAAAQSKPAQAANSIPFENAANQAKPADSKTVPFENAANQTGAADSKAVPFESAASQAKPAEAVPFARAENTQTRPAAPRKSKKKVPTVQKPVFDNLFSVSIEGNDEISVFAEDLPEWSIEPPVIPVKRRFK